MDIVEAFTFFVVMFGFVTLGMCERRLDVGEGGGGLLLYGVGWRSSVVPVSLMSRV